MNHTLPNTRFPNYDLTKPSDLKAINKAVLDQMELTNPEIQKKLIGLFGIRNAKQMDVFLKSLEGKAEMAQIAKAIAILVKIQEHNAQERMDNSRRRKMLLAFLLLGALSRSDAKSKRLNAIILQQYKKLLELRKNNGNDQSSDFISVTDEVLHAYMSGLDTIIQEQEALNNEFASIAADEKSLNERYGLYEESLTSIDELFDKDINELQSEELEGQITKLSSEIDEQTDVITKHLENNNDEKARHLLNDQNAKNLKIAGLKDLLAVKLGEKLLLSEHGSQVNKYKDSAYITEPSKKLIKFGDELLLINAHDEKNIEENDGLRKQARNDFLNRKAEMTPLRQLIKNNEKSERDVLNFRTERATKQQKQLNTDASELFNLINSTQSAQATLSLTPGAPKPGITAPNSRLNSKLQSTAAHYAVARLETLQYHPVGGAGSPFDLRAALQNLGNNPALDNIRKELNDINPGQPIPKELYALILQRNNLTTANPWSDNLNTADYLKGPADQLYNKQVQNQAQPPEEKSTPPTPFNTTPRHGK